MSDYNNGYYSDAVYEFKALGDYKDSYEMWRKSLYADAMYYYNNGRYESAADRFEDLGYYKDSYEMWQKSAYGSAMSDFDNESYESAVEKFKALEDYEDSYDMWQMSMYGYVVTHFDNSDTLTYEYLETLDGLGHDLEDVYHELYDWRVERAFVNTDSSDSETELDFISRTETWCAHFVIGGGRPGEELQVYLKRKSAGDSSYRDDYKQDVNLSLKDGSEIFVDGWHYEDPFNGKTGTWVMSLFDAETDELLGSATVEIIE